MNQIRPTWIYIDPRTKDSRIMRAVHKFGKKSIPALIATTLWPWACVALLAIVILMWVAEVAS